MASNSNKLRNMFREKGEVDTRTMNDNRATIVLANAYVDICYTACKECYNGTLSFDYDARTKYIQDKVKRGHESVTEHSNIVMMLNLNKNNIQDLVNVTAYGKFLTFEVQETLSEYVILVGGSILAFKQLIRRIPDINNSVLILIIGCLYELDKSFFYDLIEDNIMIADKFVGDPERFEIHKIDPSECQLDRMDWVNIDDIQELRSKVPDIIPTRKLFKFISITIYFNAMSRVITQQLTRHRNAISQLSQRYVDESGATFFSPVQFREDKTEVSIEWGGQTWTSQSLGDFLLTVYPAAREAGLLKEEARSFLPSNTKSSLFVTFKGDTLAHFINMRCDKHAQSEIRMFANELRRVYEPILQEHGIESTKALMEPEYRLMVSNDYSIIDEVID